MDDYHHPSKALAPAGTVVPPHLKPTTSGTKYGVINMTKVGSVVPGIPNENSMRSPALDRVNFKLRGTKVVSAWARAFGGCNDNVRL